MTGGQRDDFPKLAHGLVQALDAWAACVGEPLSKDKPARKVLVRALEQERATPEWRSRAPIDGPLLSYWLRGGGQLLPGTKHNRLPGVEDSAAIARALKPYAPGNAERLPMIGREIADLARRLQATAGRGWRRRIGESGYVRSPGQAGPEASSGPSATVASSGAAERETAEPAAFQGNVEPVAAAGPEPAEPLPVEPVTMAVSPGAPIAAAGDGPEPAVILAVGRAERTSRPARKRWIGAGAFIAVAAAVAMGLWVWPGGAKPGTAGKGPDGPASPSARAMDVGGPGVVASTEPDGLKGNHRCGRLRSAGTVTWKPCMIVTDRATMVFLVHFTNTSGKPMRLKAKLAYVQAAVEQTCPAPWGTAVTVIIPARTTRISPLKACTAALTPVQAFQTRAWVVPHDAAQWGYREHSPTLHVQEAGTPVWADQAR